MITPFRFGSDCTHIYTGTAPGLNYLLAQLNGKRAHVITMLVARVGYNALPYKPVQVLSWAIQNGQTYGELTPASRALVDQVIPDQRAALGDDFVEQVSAYWNDYVRGHRGLPDFETELHRLGPQATWSLNMKGPRMPCRSTPTTKRRCGTSSFLRAKRRPANGAIRPGAKYARAYWNA